MSAAVALFTFSIQRSSARCYDARMKRTTISLPDEVALLAEREARRRGVSLSEVARDALAEHLGIDRRVPRPLPFANLGRSRHTDTSTRVDEVLAARWTRDIERHRDR